MKIEQHVEIQLGPTGKQLHSHDMQLWCKENIGQRGVDWQLDYNPGMRGIFTFANKQNAMMFTLKWS